ncbi:MAG: 6-bladed beta-propeller [Balneolaceae bacterium]
MNKITYFLGVLFICVYSAACGGSESSEKISELTTFVSETDLVIGLLDQPLEYQLGRPHRVRTDSVGNIYIADRQSLTIKIFDNDGNYLKELGGRGRGPGEFLDINMMAKTPEGHLVFLDVGNLRYTIISTEGESIAQYPVKFGAGQDPPQFYPSSVVYDDNFLIGLEVGHDEFRHLFHVYSPDFSKRHYVFAPISDIELDHVFATVQMAFYPGSIAMNADLNEFIYSPGIYTGRLYRYQYMDDSRWEMDGVLNGAKTSYEPFLLFENEAQYLNAREDNVPGITRPAAFGERHPGKLNSMDCGIFFLNDGRLVQFYGEWKEDAEIESDQTQYPFDLMVQVFDQEGELEHHGYLFTILRENPVYQYPLINWKDDEDRFYLLGLSDEGLPSVRRFIIEFPVEEPIVSRSVVNMQNGSDQASD